MILTTQRGTIVRQRVRDISVQGRTATGVLVQRLDSGNHIRSVALVPEDMEGEEAIETTSTTVAEVDMDMQE